MEAVVMVLGLFAEAAAWWRVSRGGNVWAWMAPVLVGLGAAALLAGPPAWTPRVDPAIAVLVGLGLGLVLYGATKAFVAVVSSWSSFRKQAVAIYQRQRPLSLGAALVLSVALLAPGEELFWRGLIQTELAEALDGATLLAAALTWGAFVISNLPSRNLAIVAGAVVGGAVWTTLGWWTGGALASVLCHGVWTALMLSFPVVREPTRTAA